MSEPGCAGASTPEIYAAGVGYFESVQETLGRLAAAIAEREPVSMLAERGGTRARKNSFVTGG